MFGRTFVCLPLTVFLLTVAQAQPTKKVPRIGVLSAPSRSAIAEFLDAFREGLRNLGYIEGKNLIIEYRYADGKANRLPNLAAELIRLNVDVIVTGGGRQIRAAKKATDTIPIVMTNVSDPVELGFVASLARPGGNITGLSTLGPEVGGKRLELLKEAFPHVSRVAVLWEPGGPGATLRMKQTEAVAPSLGIKIQPVEIRELNDFERALFEMKKARAEALVPLRSPLIADQVKRIVELAAKDRLPAMYEEREFVDAGGLMFYGTAYADLFRRAATYVDKILKGTKPADIPVEQPTKFELVINLKAAKQIGVTIPQSVLFRADRVIK